MIKSDSVELIKKKNPPQVKNNKKCIIVGKFKVIEIDDEGIICKDEIGEVIDDEEMAYYIYNNKRAYIMDNEVIKRMDKQEENDITMELFNSIDTLNKLKLFLADNQSKCITKSVIESKLYEILSVYKNNYLPEYYYEVLYHLIISSHVPERVINNILISLGIKFKSYKKSYELMNTLCLDGTSNILRLLVLNNLYDEDIIQHINNSKDKVNKEILDLVIEKLIGNHSSTSYRRNLTVFNDQIIGFVEIVRMYNLYRDSNGSTKEDIQFLHDIIFKYSKDIFKDKYILHPSSYSTLDNIINNSFTFIKGYEDNIELIKWYFDKLLDGSFNLLTKKEKEIIINANIKIYRAYVEDNTFKSLSRISKNKLFAGSNDVLCNNSRVYLNDYIKEKYKDDIEIKQLLVEFKLRGK